MPQIIQFTHPGAEHRPDRGASNWKSWNIGNHKRKFLVTKGKCVENGSLRSGELAFWGEWEPPSMVERVLEAESPYHPKWIHRPYLPEVIPDPIQDGVTYQNTDPFVFGDAFRYFVCKQFRINQKIVTALSRLEKGALILFGSTVHQNTPDAFFQLDTVFVVSDYVPYDADDPDALSDQGLYRDIAYKMAFPTRTGFPLHLRMYRGATYEGPVNGMYSFTPCRRWEGQPDSVFPRLPLNDEKYITNNLNSGPKISEASEEEVLSMWKKIRGLSREAGCAEGVHFPMPATESDSLEVT